MAGRVSVDQACRGGAACAGDAFAGSPGACRERLRDAAEARSPRYSFTDGEPQPDPEPSGRSRRSRWPRSRALHPEVCGAGRAGALIEAAIREARIGCSVTDRPMPPWPTAWSRLPTAHRGDRARRASTSSGSTSTSTPRAGGFRAAVDCPSTWSTVSPVTACSSPCGRPRSPGERRSRPAGSCRAEPDASSRPATAAADTPAAPRAVGTSRSTTSGTGATTGRATPGSSSACAFHHDAHHRGEFAIAGDADGRRVAVHRTGGWLLTPLVRSLHSVDEPTTGRTARHHSSAGRPADASIVTRSTWHL